jgi:hypothetical protein
MTVFCALLRPLYFMTISFMFMAFILSWFNIDICILSHLLLVCFSCATVERVRLGETERRLDFSPIWLAWIPMNQIILTGQTLRVMSHPCFLQLPKNWPITHAAMNVTLPRFYCVLRLSILGFWQLLPINTLPFFLRFSYLPFTTLKICFSFFTYII